ncbi:tripartite tricarboxylate transporter TctB family protein [Puniceibacterium sp. IMCC21224]|uniref:tripartite tricarboxylate transporter TctB family protein n=1 Tax=Puniceibacterium sp. IMCC21224 TaxID=1618204 RepID=UPI00064DC3F7|nr:tripartite tricarboxylate transporter TctB family protein [Puniceibacterium sp. IMCC21224]KMK65145.1 Tripartite tricarboxylate transporter TctB family [Puniceibacterium sp. IMCC21224]
MTRRDMVAGLALIVMGGAYAAHTLATLPIGTLRQMGPGMFPMGLGLLLAGLGVGVAVPALARDVPMPTVPHRSLWMCIGTVIAFALIIPRFGLIPAVVASTIIAALAIRSSRWQVILPMAVLMVPLSWFVFVFLLQIDIPLAQWRL